MTKVKINTEQNQKIQKNSMVARGIKLALREINKEIKKQAIKSPSSPLAIPTQFSSVLQNTKDAEKPKGRMTALEALSKKY